MYKRLLLSLFFTSLLTSCLGGGELNNSEGDFTLLETSDIPIVTGTSPASPAIDSAPTVDGTSEASATVNIYTDSTCSTLIASGSADTSGNFSVSVSIAGDSSATYYAKATAPNKLISACSTTSVTYRNNSIASGLAWFLGTETTAPSTPTRVNQTTAYELKWSTSEFDSTYYSHSTSSNQDRITFQAAGDYLLAATLPLSMISGTYRPCTRLEVRLNGTLIDTAIGESSYIRNDGGHTESSSHIAVLLKDISAGDFIEVFLQETAGHDGSEVVNITSTASMYLEYLASSRNIFSATATQTTLGTNINQTTAASLEWTEQREDSGFSHSDASQPEDITLVNGGNYLVHINVPITSSAVRSSPRLLVQLDDVASSVNGGQAAQTYIRADSGHNDSSLHWSGYLFNVSAGAILHTKMQRASEAGTVTVQATGKASIFIEELASATGLIALRATTNSGGSNWNPASAENILWDTSDIHDTNTYSHSTVLNQHQITVLSQGDYLLTYNDILDAPSAQRSNPKVKVQINGSDLSGAETKTHYARNSSAHSESSASLVFLLRNLAVNDIISITIEQEGIAGVVNDVDDALLTIQKK